MRIKDIDLVDDYPEASRAEKALEQYLSGRPLHMRFSFPTKETLRLRYRTRWVDTGSGLVVAAILVYEARRVPAK